MTAAADSPDVAGSFSARVRSESGLVGYWVGSDNMAMTERLARVGFDYIVMDAQHGLLDAAACVRGLFAIDAGGTDSGTVGVVRVAANRLDDIGRALDAGAAGVIVPLVNSAAEAADAVSACRYPPDGIRSYGPVRSSLRIGPDTDVANRSVACVVMIETVEALDNVEAIASVQGVDALYVGPSDLSLSLGNKRPSDGWSSPEFAEALSRVRAAAATAGKGCGMHCTDGEIGNKALTDGFSFVSLSDDLAHLQYFAGLQLATARGR